MTSVSFASTKTVPPLEPDGFTCTDFVVGTAKALIVGMNAFLFDKLRAEDRRGTLLVQGFDSQVGACAANPKTSQVVVGSNSGALQVLNNRTKYQRF